jgi:hypothetical protein
VSERRKAEKIREVKRSEKRSGEATISDLSWGEPVAPTHPSYCISSTRPSASHASPALPPLPRMYTLIFSLLSAGRASQTASRCSSNRSYSLNKVRRGDGWDRLSSSSSLD